MEGKTVIMTTLLLGLIWAQIQVEGLDPIGVDACCTTAVYRNCYEECRSIGESLEYCVIPCRCKIIVAGDPCPLENTGDNVVNEYCKLGCVSSVCGAITTLQKSDASEVVNGAIENCTKTCSALCTKGSITAVKSA